MPMQRRLPKKGFKNPFRTQIFAVNVGDIDERFAAGVVTLAELQTVGLVPRKYERVKVLGEGNITKKFVVKADAFSGSAKEEIEKSGGRVEIVGAESST